MFGYVRPSLAKLSREDRERFSAMYCGLCRTLSRRCGRAASLILNYDFTFLAVLLAEGEPGEPHHGRCPAHPWAGRDYFPHSGAMDLAADCSVILAWWQLRDDIQDGGGPSLKSRSAALLLRGAYERARRSRPAFDEATRRQLSALSRLEAERCSSMDQAADTFALLLQSAALQVEDGVKRRVLEQALYHLGRWIYLVDAWDDLADDRRTGSYNPISARFSGETEANRDYLRTTLRHSLNLARSAAALLELGHWRETVENILFLGLPMVEELVFTGRWKAVNQHNRRQNP